MADVIGILGITITVFDQLLKLGERTAVLVDDARAFGDVSTFSTGLSVLLRDVRKRRVYGFLTLTFDGNVSRILIPRFPSLTGTDSYYTLRFEILSTNNDLHLVQSPRMKAK